MTKPKIKWSWSIKTKDVETLNKLSTSLMSCVQFLSNLTKVMSWASENPRRTALTTWGGHRLLWLVSNSGATFCPSPPTYVGTSRAPEKTGSSPPSAFFSISSVSRWQWHPFSFRPPNLTLHHHPVHLPAAFRSSRTVVVLLPVVEQLRLQPLFALCYTSAWWLPRELSKLQWSKVVLLPKEGDRRPPSEINLTEHYKKQLHDDSMSLNDRDVERSGDPSFWRSVLHRVHQLLCGVHVLILWPIGHQGHSTPILMKINVTRNHTRIEGIFSPVERHQTCAVHCHEEPSTLERDDKKFGLSQSLLPIVTTLNTKLLLEKYSVPPCPTDHIGRDTEYSVKNWTRNLGRSPLTRDSPKPQEVRTPSFPCLSKSNTLFRLLQDLHPRSCSDISHLEPVENPIRTLTWKPTVFLSQVSNKWWSFHPVTVGDFVLIQSRWSTTSPGRTFSTVFMPSWHCYNQVGLITL